MLLSSMKSRQRVESHRDLLQRQLDAVDRALRWPGSGIGRVSMAEELWKYATHLSSCATRRPVGGNYTTSYRECDCGFADLMKATECAESILVDTHTRRFCQKQKFHEGNHHSFDVRGNPRGLSWAQVATSDQNEVAIP